jgi:hypothetical protein
MVSECVAGHSYANDFLCMRKAKIFALLIVLGCFGFHGKKYINYGECVSVMS